MVGHPGEKVGHCLAFPQELGRWGGGGGLRVEDISITPEASNGQ